MNLLQYNTNRKQLIIPEYGRHIHLMIEQIMEKKDKSEKNKLAKAVIGVMGNLNPHLRDVPDFQHKLWDQLFIMSDFKLDVDSPYVKPEAEILFAKPKCPLVNGLNLPKLNTTPLEFSKLILSKSLFLTNSVIISI